MGSGLRVRALPTIGKNGRMTGTVRVADFIDAFGEDPGDLPDGVVLNSSHADWQPLLDALHAAGWPMVLNGAESSPVPREIPTLLATDEFRTFFVYPVSAVGVNFLCTREGPVSLTSTYEKSSPRRPSMDCAKPFDSSGYPPRRMLPSRTRVFRGPLFSHSTRRPTASRSIAESRRRSESTPEPELDDVSL